MKLVKNLAVLTVVSVLLVSVCQTVAHDDDHEGDHHSTAGLNPWNRGKAPEDPWKAIEQMHGHVGPWNIVGWKIGQRALKDFNTEWGRHDLDITVYIPLETPYSCIADGLIMGTGNSLGRLDIRISEVPKLEMICVKIFDKDHDGSFALYKPRVDYLKTILEGDVEDLEHLSRECMDKQDEDVFVKEIID